LLRWLSWPSAWPFHRLFRGNIAGTVQDPSGAAVPNAAITITDLDRGSVYNLQSSGSGEFSQTHLVAGHYQVKVTRSGFATFAANPTVQVDATTPLDVKLSPANVQTSRGLNTGSASTTGLPAFYTNGDGGFNFGYALGVNQCNCPLKETENQFQWVNNWTKIKGQPHDQIRR
jgi:Carboxypeptidase regulatory-like domain